jgi:predicted cupin superfamily sugar epimerase
MINKPSVKDLILKYNLVKHVEGGYYYRGYRSLDIIKSCDLPDRFKGDRSLSSAIYYLIINPNVSKLHRLLADEIWHFYLGDPFTLIEVLDDGSVKKTILGNDICNNQNVQYVVKNNTWFGGYVSTLDGYSLIGCTVSPGFNEDDFELCEKKWFLNKYPHLEESLSKVFF